MHNLPTGPYILAIKPFGKTTDWNFKACTRLWPLYKIRRLSPGRAIGLTVPSINPKQFCRGAPLAVIAAAYISIWSGSKISWFHRVILGLWAAYIMSSTAFVTILITGTGFANRGIISAYLHGNDKRLKTMQRPSRPSQVDPCSHRMVSGMPRTSASMGMSLFRNLNSEKHSDSVISSRLNGE